MKTRVLLVDSSITVQKVVSLTLERELYDLDVAATGSDAMDKAKQNPPDLVLISDQVGGVSLSTFAREIKTLKPVSGSEPTLVVISHGARDSAPWGFASVLAKPFSPQELMQCVNEYSVASDPTHTGVDTIGAAFAEEPGLVGQTLAHSNNHASALGSTELESEVLWGSTSGHLAEEQAPSVLTSGGSMAYKAQLEAQVTTQLEQSDLESIVRRVVAEVVPPIVEKVASELLQKMLTETEGFTEVRS